MRATYLKIRFRICFIHHHQNRLFKVIDECDGSQAFSYRHQNQLQIDDIRQTDKQTQTDKHKKGFNNLTSLRV